MRRGEAAEEHGSDPRNEWITAMAAGMPVSLRHGCTFSAAQTLGRKSSKTASKRPVLQVLAGLSRCSLPLTLIRSVQLWPQRPDNNSIQVSSRCRGPSTFPRGLSA